MKAKLFQAIRFLSSCSMFTVAVLITPGVYKSILLSKDPGTIIFGHLMLLVVYSTALLCGIMTYRAKFWDKIPVKIQTVTSVELPHNDKLTPIKGFRSKTNLDQWWNNLGR